MEESLATVTTICPANLCVCNCPNPGIKPSLLSCQVQSLPLAPPVKSNSTSILVMSQNAWSRGYKSDNVSPSVKLASLIAQLVKIHLQCRRPRFDSWVGKIRWRRNRLPTPVFWGFPCGLAGKRIHPQCVRPEFDPWVGKIPWRREGLPTPIFWLGELHGLYSLWGCKESDTTK